MELTMTLSAPGLAEIDVEVAAQPGTAVGELAPALAAAVGATSPALSVAGRELPPAHPVGVAPLLEGARVCFSAPVKPQTHSADRLRRVLVVGGPDSGGGHPLAAGRTVIGRGADAAIRIADPDLSRRHAVIEARPDGVWIADAGSANGTWVDGVEVGTEPVPLPPGAIVRCGSSLLCHGGPPDPPAAVRPDTVGGLGLHRPPRLRARRTAVEIVLPPAPAERPRFRFPWVLVLAPLLLGGVLWLATGGNSAYLLLTLLSPVMFAANAIGDRLVGGREHRRAMAQYASALKGALAERDAALVREAIERRDEAPDPAALLATALGPGPRLWERRRGDDDALLLRLGTAHLPARLAVRDGPDFNHPALADVPVTVPLRSVGVLGLAGAWAGREGLARWVVAQLAALHTPRDLRLVLLAADEATGWRWLRWLPHARPFAGQDCRVLCGLGAAQVAARVTELVALLESRAGEREPAGPFVVVLMDGAGSFRSMPGVARLLAEGPAAGIHAVCLVEDALELPEECGATAVLTDSHGAGLRVTVAGDAPVDGVTADLVSPAWVDRLARGLAPIRDTTPGGSDGIPDQVGLLELLSISPLDPGLIADRWRTATPSTRTLLGLGVGGRPVTVDLAADGPHALVAGTTGAGKSELLQTLIAGLALANRPDEISFLLVDYKGGAAFADCARLPHTVGMVTDLDANLTARALESLRAELRRRERLLAAAGAKDLESYQAKAASINAEPPSSAPPHPGSAVETAPPAGPPGGPAAASAPSSEPPGGPAAASAPPAGLLARLVIVIDEFASLVAELPDFVPGLVDIARRGRSLGVHLVLATQRPAGVVSAEIRANTALRVCLRVTDKVESADVLDAPDAARIPRQRPGRAIARLADGGLTALQIARVGGRPPRRPATALSVTPIHWRVLGESRAPADHPSDPDVPTDLARIVNALRSAAAAAAVSPPQSPWLPPLPDRVTLSELADADAGGGAPDAIAFGLQDLPAEQRRAAYALDLVTGRHLLIAGAARSGRTSALRAISAGLASRFPVGGAHLYALDCGSGGLTCLEALPHCGAVVPRDDPDRGERLLSRLEAEVNRRMEVAAGAGFGSVADYKTGPPGSERPPWVVLLLDSWEGFVQTYEAIDHGRVVDQLLRLMREGTSAGLRVVITGDRGLLSSRAVPLVGDRLLLRMHDPESYGLAGLTPRAVPTHMPPGRALACGGAGGHGATEVQLAQLDPDPAGPAQLAALARIAAEAAHRDAAERAAVATPRDPVIHTGASASVTASADRAAPAGVATPAGVAAPAGVATPTGGAAPTRVATPTDRAAPTCASARPFRLRPLPSRVTLAELTAAGSVNGSGGMGAQYRTALWTLLGAGGDEATPIGIDLGTDGPGGLVAGPPGSGRSTVLVTAAGYQLGRGTAVAIVASGRSPLLGLAGAPGVLGVFSPGNADAAAELRTALAAACGPAVLLADDVDQLLDTELDEVIKDVLRAGDGRIGVLASGVTEDLHSIYRGSTVELRRSRSGVLLRPAGRLDGELLGVRLSRGCTARPGRGVLVRRGAATPIQIATTQPPPTARPPPVGPRRAWATRPQDSPPTRRAAGPLARAAPG